MKGTKYLVLLIFPVLVKGITEEVWLEDLNPDIRLRGFETVLPQQLEFTLRRLTEPDVELKLEENLRLNANAPVYETVLENGKQRAIKRESQPITGTKFYQDKKLGAAMKVSCHTQTSEYCRRMLEGSLILQGHSYELEPYPGALTARWMVRSKSDSYILRRVDSRPLPNFGRHLGAFGTDYKRIPDHNEDMRDVPDGKPIPIPPGSMFFEDERGNLRDVPDGKPIPSPPATSDPDDELISRLRSLLLQTLVDNNERHLNRQKRQSATEYAVEIVMVIDPAVWEKYYNSRLISGMTADQATEYILREKLAHVMNGVSLRYESIENPDMNVYVTISGFLFYKTVASGNPLPPSHKIITSNGVKYADSDVYIDNLVKWASTLSGLPDNDHIMVITGYELYSGGNIEYSGVAGVAYVSGVCGNYRVSVQEDGGYFFLTSVAAHELGHNLGADHDGEAGSKCTADEQYIMAPYVPTFSPTDTYNMNPWHFSNCSVSAFINQFKAVNCLTDESSYYNKAEWELHNSKQPGELYTLDQQCKLIYGSESELCNTDVNDEKICLAIGCKDPRNGYCNNHVPARGSPCGQELQNKWCIKGKCERKQNATTGMPPTQTSATTRATWKTTTRRPSTTTSWATTTPWATTMFWATTTSTGDCVDSGWEDWSCQKLSNFFSKQTYKPNYLCTSSYWSQKCCAFCSGGGRCVDKGFKSLDCPTLSRFLQDTLDLLSHQWCTFSKLHELCCGYCQRHG